MINHGHINNFTIGLNNSDLHILEDLQDKILDILSDEWDNTNVRSEEYLELEKISEIYAERIISIINRKKIYD